MIGKLLSGAAACFLATASVAQSIDPKDGLSGEEVNTIVAEALLEFGIVADPQIAILRSFPACDTIPTVSPKFDDWSTAELSCTSPSPWSRAVRTQVGSSYAAGNRDNSEIASIDAVVLKESLSRGTVLMPEHLEVQNVSNRTTDQTFSDINSIIGRKLTVNLGEGRAVLSRHLEKEWLIRENNPVAIVYSGGVFAVTAAGVALQDGQLGELIEVRNVGSDLMIKAVVAGKNKVLVSTKMN